MWFKKQKEKEQQDFERDVEMIHESFKSQQLKYSTKQLMNMIEDAGLDTIKLTEILELINDEIEYYNKLFNTFRCKYTSCIFNGESLDFVEYLVKKLTEPYNFIINRINTIIDENKEYEKYKRFYNRFVEEIGGQDDRIESRNIRVVETMV